MARAASANALLPAPVEGWPVLAHTGDRGWPADDVDKALTRIRAEALWWPAPKSAAKRIPVITEGLSNLAAIIPSGIERVDAASDNLLHRYGVLGGKAEGDAAAMLASSRWTCPWTGSDLPLTDGVEALSFLHAAARRNSGGFHLIGMSPWKRRCLAPFLTGPDGPPRRRRTPGDLGRGRRARWRLAG